MEVGQVTVVGTPWPDDPVVSVPIHSSDGFEFMMSQAIADQPVSDPGGPPALARISGPSDPSSAMIRELLDRIVASVFEVDTTLLKLPTRGRRPVAEARQVAMYLAHVACGLSYTDVGRIFERDRTTVAYACKKTEDRREAAEFDSAIELLEQSIRMIHLTEAGTCGR